MPKSNIEGYDPILVATGLSVIAVHLIALGMAVKDRWDQHKNSDQNKNDLRKNQVMSGRGMGECRTSEDAGRHYPYISRSDVGANALRSSAAFGRYAKDGRRRLAGNDECNREDESEVPRQQAEAYAKSDPAGRAMSSRDILLTVFRFLDRRDILVCGNVSVVLNQAATDDTIWMNLTKADMARRLPSYHQKPGPRTPRRTKSPQFVYLQAGLGRVMEAVYAQLPRSYFDIYPRLPPTREVPAPRKARQTWHRLYLIMMAWMPFRILEHHSQGVGGRVAKGRKVTRTRLALENRSRALMESYGMTYFFPEQMLSFVYFLFYECCEDYFDELVRASTDTVDLRKVLWPRFAVSTEPQKLDLPVVPAWGDMLSVVNGYVELYKGRIFMVLKDNMGFLLHDPTPRASRSRSSDSNDSDRQDGPGNQGEGQSSSAATRELRIACTHRNFIRTLETPVASFTRWPYAKRMTLDGFMAEFHKVERSRR